jgi:hypothetical protein
MTRETQSMSDEDTRRLTRLESELADLKGSVLLALKAIRDSRRPMQPIDPCNPSST